MQFSSYFVQLLLLLFLSPLFVLAEGNYMLSCRNTGTFKRQNDLILHGICGRAFPGLGRVDSKGQQLIDLHYTELPLNWCIGNNDGTMYPQTHGGAFASCYNCAYNIHNGDLECDCPPKLRLITNGTEEADGGDKAKKWWSLLSLNAFIRNANGHLRCW